jgi:hypothetical protein
MSLFEAVEEKSASEILEFSTTMSDVHMYTVANSAS